MVPVAYTTAGTLIPAAAACKVIPLPNDLKQSTHTGLIGRGPGRAMPAGADGLGFHQGLGGLQIQTPEGNWVDAPSVAGALTVNIGDLLARWTGDRWRSTPHRVLPPPADAPHEDLISLILFCKANSDTVIAPLPGSIGHTDYPPITAGDYLRERIAQTKIPPEAQQQSPRDS